jgi:hypothetical protein
MLEGVPTRVLVAEVCPLLSARELARLGLASRRLRAVVALRGGGRAALEQCGFSAAEVTAMLCAGPERCDLLLLRFVQQLVAQPLRSLHGCGTEVPGLAAALARHKRATSSLSSLDASSRAAPEELSERERAWSAPAGSRAQDGVPDDAEPERLTDDAELECVPPFACRDKLVAMAASDSVIVGAFAGGRVEVLAMSRQHAQRQAGAEAEREAAVAVTQASAQAPARDGAEDDAWWSAMVRRGPAALAPGLAIRSVTCNRGHAAFVTRCGTLWTVGDNSDGALGLGLSSAEQPAVLHPHKVANLAGVLDASCGLYHTMAVTAGGELYGSGCNLHGQLGLAQVQHDSAGRFLRVPLPQARGPAEQCQRERAAQVVCGHFATMVVTRTGRVLACGRGAYGSLGLGDTADHDELTPLALLETTRCVQLACGRAHTVFLAADGAVYGAGVGRAGQLGATITGLEPSPRRLLDIPPAQALACGADYTVVLPLAAEAPAILLGLASAHTDADPAWS